MFKKLFKDEIKPAIAGLKQAIGVVIYCGFVASFISFTESLAVQNNQLLNITLVLILLVFSAAIAGFLVFGFPVYLMINKKTNEALSTLGYTFLYLFLIFLLILLILYI